MKLPIDLSLNGKVAVLTGAGGVIGAHFAKVLSKAGATVVVTDLKQDAAQKVVDSIQEEGGNAVAVGVNVLEPSSLLEARNTITAEFGGIDILINGAGGNHPKATTAKEVLEAVDIGPHELPTFFDLDPEGIKFVFDLNFLGTLLPTQVFTPMMVGREGATIINISSMNAFRPLTKIPAYSAAKAAVSNFTQWLAVHFAPVAIRVNAIAPGFFVTNQNQTLLYDEFGQLTERSQKILSHTPMNRFGEVSDLTGTLLWLASHEASGFVNGIVVPVDGGFAAYSGV